MPSLPDYYRILGVSQNASANDIRQGYRKQSLRTHPDRVADPTKRQQATQDFQKVADAYYVLSDPERRANYDAQRHSQPDSFTSTSASSSNDYFSQFFRAAAGQAPYASSESSDGEDGLHPDAESTFGDQFEELLRPEVHRIMPMWTYAGAMSGAVLGFIAGNLPGAAIGAYGGSRLGAVRDAKGKAVYEVFKEMEIAQRAEILRGLAFKVLGSMAN